MAAAADELERLRLEVHGLQVEVRGKPCAARGPRLLPQPARGPQNSTVALHHRGALPPPRAQVNALQGAVADKDALLSRALADAQAADARRREAAAQLAEATRCALGRRQAGVVWRIARITARRGACSWADRGRKRLQS